MKSSRPFILIGFNQTRLSAYDTIQAGLFMKLTFAFLAALLFLPAAAHAQRSMSTAEVPGFVQSQIKIGDDRATADYLLHKVKLSQKLDVRSVEDLQGKGAGPQTVRALRRLAEDSAALPEPP